MMQSLLLLALLIAAFPLARLEVHLSQASWPKQKARPVTAFIAGLFFVVLAVFCAYHIYVGIQTSLIGCIGRDCIGQYSASEDPLKYWGTVALWYSAFVFSISTILHFKRAHFGNRSEP